MSNSILICNEFRVNLIYTYLLYCETTTANFLLDQVGGYLVEE